MDDLTIAIVHSVNGRSFFLGDCHTVNDIKEGLSSFGFDADKQLLVAQIGTTQHPNYVLLNDDEEELQNPDLDRENPAVLNVALHTSLPIDPPRDLSLNVTVEPDTFRPHMERGRIITNLNSGNTVLRLKEVIDELYGVPPTRQFLHVTDVLFHGQGLIRFPVFGPHAILGTMLMLKVDDDNMEHHITVTCSDRRPESTVQVNVVVKLLEEDSPQPPQVLELELQRDTVSTLTMEINSMGVEFRNEDGFQIFGRNGDEIRHGSVGTTTLAVCGINANDTIYVYEI